MNFKLSRRGFLGTAAVAPVAVPMAIGDQVSHLGKGYSPGIPFNYVYDKAAKTIKETLYGDGPDCPKEEWDEVGYIKKEIQAYIDRKVKLRTRINEIQFREFAKVEAHRLDTLKSVSPVNKARMLTEYLEEMQIRREISGIDQGIRSHIERLTQMETPLKNIGFTMEMLGIKL